MHWCNQLDCLEFNCCRINQIWCFHTYADNHGEGGTFALCGLLTSENSFLGRRRKKVIIVISMLAGSLLLGDGALTPAVSVLSAVEGVAIEAPKLQKWIVPITVIILILLFVAQRWGTSKIGITFGPIMCLWFLCLFMIGIWRTTYKPSIFKAFNPWEAFHYLLVEKKRGFYQIGGVFLSVTGLEALYADLGHFGRWPIRCSWFFIVFPAVLFNYLGQGALLIVDPTLIDNPFYHSVPHWGHWPMIVLATIATIIASQAIITDLYTWSSNAIKIPSGGWVAILIGFAFFILGFCWFFAIRLGILFRDSRQDSRISFTDIPIVWTIKRTEPDNISYSDSDSDSYVGCDANGNGTLPKVQSRVQLIQRVSIPLPSSGASSNLELHNMNTNDTIPAVVTPCIACFLTMSKKHTPHVFENFVSHMHSIPQVIIFLKIEYSKRAIINDNERLTVKTYGDNIYHITASYGYSQYRIKPYEILLLASAQYNVPIPNDELQVTFFVPNETIKVSTVGWRSWIRRWPLYIYSILKSLYPGAAVNIKLNPENTISIGILAKLN
ncbi:unnamed protein product [Rotaria sordida]|uniref:Uncharacterized protein n=1 Tax=Rotaria sordida TaxID=392033 RepID=A0A815ZSU3_9BILA|nr:unnamed protein product [Rotaria sordida]